MTAVTYTAQRDLTTGHVQGTAYTIQLRCRAFEPVKRVRKSASVAIAGNTETIVLSNFNLRDVVTKNLNSGDRDIVREFLESVIEGETFTVDEFGTPNAPDLPASAILEGQYTETRTVQLGDGGRDDYFQFRFRLRLL